MEPKELINISLFEEIDIEPNTIIPPIEMFAFNFKGCHPLLPCKVPLFIALHLERLNQCTIKHPRYLNKEFLENIIDKEKKSEEFIEIPEFLFEHAHVFMNQEIEFLISELKRLRHKKVQKGLRVMDSRALCINGLSKWEFYEFKHTITKAMQLGKRIETKNFQLEND